MNCKPGDLAQIVRALYDPEHVGKIVTCRQWAPDAWGGAWATDPVLRRSSSGAKLVWHDDDLRPIRDPGDDAIDEMVLIVGKPEGVTA